MILSIDTTDNKLMEIALDAGDGRPMARKKIKTDFNQAEKLMPSIIGFLETKKANLKDITKIKIADQGGSFTSLRIGVVTANALAYALNVPVKGGRGDFKKFGNSGIVEPVYDREPSITIKKDLV
jgi:tRNA threonylcarbamoyladenosine biosynthesis protein TsaB